MLASKFPQLTTRKAGYCRWTTDFGQLLDALYVDLPRPGQMSFDFQWLKEHLEEPIWRELCTIPYRWAHPVDIRVAQWELRKATLPPHLSLSLVS